MQVLFILENITLKSRYIHKQLIYFTIFSTKKFHSDMPRALQ